MKRWCPVCESPGRPVVQGTPSVDDVRMLENGSAVRVRETLPGIEPSHLCTRCPTYFRRDRFYLTAVHDEPVHGIAVRPHHEPRLRVELGAEGLVMMFADGASILVVNDDISALLNDFFEGYGKNRIVTWASRRGCEIRLVPQGGSRVSVEVAASGPHFSLLVAKSWLRNTSVRSCADALVALDAVGAQPLFFPPAEMLA